jgi:hypothetical protein
VADLFTLEELASHLQSDLDTATATLARARVVAYLESELGVVLTQRTGTVTFHPEPSTDFLRLPWPSTVTAVTVNGVALVADDWYLVNSLAEIRLVSKCWGGFAGDIRKLPTVVVSLTYGYLTPPAVLKAWGLLLAGQAYQLAPKIGLQSESIDDYSVAYATGAGAAADVELPPAVLNRLRAKFGRGVQVAGSR